MGRAWRPNLVAVGEVVEIEVSAAEGNEDPHEEEDGVASGEEDLAGEGDEEEDEGSVCACAGPEEEHPEGCGAQGGKEGAEGDDEEAGGRGEADDGEDIAEGVEEAGKADEHEEGGADRDVGAGGHGRRLLLEELVEVGAVGHVALCTRENGK